jgi:hypothetical protein
MRPDPIAQSGSWAIAVADRVMPSGTLPAIWSAQTDNVLPSARCDSVSPMQMIVRSPARDAAFAFADTMTSVSP